MSELAIKSSPKLSFPTSGKPDKTGASASNIYYFSSYERVMAEKVAEYVAAETIAAPRFSAGLLCRADFGITPMIDTVKSFEHLKEDWNGYGAQPLSKEVVNQAINFLIKLSTGSLTERPRIAPGEDGSVCFTWGGRRPQKRLEIAYYHEDHEEETNWFFRDREGICKGGEGSTDEELLEVVREYLES